MSWRLIDHVGVALGPNGGTTPVLDLRGATFCVVGASIFGGWASAVSDSNSGVWSKVATSGGSGGWVLSYSFNFIGTLGHQFTLPGSGNYISAFVAAFAGNVVGGPDPFSSNGGSSVSSGTSVAPTTVAMGAGTKGDRLAITGLGAFGAAHSPNPTIDSGFNVIDYVAWVNNVNMGGVMAWRVLPGIVTSSPTWSWTTADSPSVGIAAFDGLASVPNNFQAVHVGDGMSTGERIR